MGRLTKEKGVLDLVFAFKKIFKIRKNVNLLIVGPYEEGIKFQIKKILKQFKSNYRYFPLTYRPEYYMQSADVICLPSYREGFGMSIIEAAASGLPSLSSRIYGLEDSTVEGQTGWKHKVADPQSIYLMLKKIIDDPNKIKLYGKKARNTAILKFKQKNITSRMLKFYFKILKDNNL